MAEDKNFSRNLNNKLETVTQGEKSDDARRRTRLLNTDDENLNELIERAASGRPLNKEERKHLHHLATFAMELAIHGGVTTQDRLGTILAVTKKIFGEDSQVYKKALEKASPYLPSQGAKNDSTDQS